MISWQNKSSKLLLLSNVYRPPKRVAWNYFNNYFPIHVYEYFDTLSNIVYTLIHILPMRVTTESSTLIDSIWISNTFLIINRILFISMYLWLKKYLHSKITSTFKFVSVEWINEWPFIPIHIMWTCKERVT